MWHIVTTFWFSVHVFCWLMTSALSIFSVLDNFCQISPLHSNAVWITRVLHLICKAHTHILLFGSKFHIILAMYVQMVDIYISKKSKILDIFDNIMVFSNPAMALDTLFDSLWPSHCLQRLALQIKTSPTYRYSHVLSKSSPFHVIYPHHNNVVDLSD